MLLPCITVVFTTLGKHYYFLHVTWDSERYNYLPKVTQLAGQGSCWAGMDFSEPICNHTTASKKGRETEISYLCFPFFPEMRITLMSWTQRQYSRGHLTCYESFYVLAIMSCQEIFFYHFSLKGREMLAIKCRQYRKVFASFHQQSSEQVPHGTHSRDIIPYPPSCSWYSGYRCRGGQPGQGRQGAGFCKERKTEVMGKGEAAKVKWVGWATREEEKKRLVQRPWGRQEQGWLEQRRGVP